jgi:hypothetical protein
MSNMQYWRVQVHDILAGEKNDISQVQVEFEAVRDNWSSSDWTRTKEPSVSRGTRVFGRPYTAWPIKMLRLRLFHDTRPASSHQC